jgi:hypothetical protein
MSVMLEHPDLKEASTRSLVAVAAIMVASALAFTLATAPLAKLLGEHAAALPAAFHGLAAFLFLFIGTMHLKRLRGVLAGLILATLIPTLGATTPCVSPVTPPSAMTPSLGPRPPYTIHGLLTLVSANLRQTGSACAGQGGYADIQAGKLVTVTDVLGKVIGVGQLGTGRPGAASGAAHHRACDFEFTVGGIPEVAVYDIRIEERGTLEYSLAEMRQLRPRCGPPWIGPER